MKIIIEIVGNNQTFFRTIDDAVLRMIAKRVVVDGDVQTAHDSVWEHSKETKISSTGNVAHSVIDDSDDEESCRESWGEIHESFENP